MAKRSEAPFNRYSKVANRQPQVVKPFASPELDGMKHTRGIGAAGGRGEDPQARLLNNEPISPEGTGGGGRWRNPEYMGDRRTGLEKTIGGGYGEDTAPEWGTEEYQQGMYNLAREQVSGQTAADVEYARTELGGRGFKAGESGIANRALMNIRRGGAERLGTESRKMAMQGMGARYGQQQDLMQMMMQKYGIDVGAQQRRFDPYYNVEQQYQGQA